MIEKWNDFNISSILTRNFWELIEHVISYARVEKQILMLFPFYFSSTLFLLFELPGGFFLFFPLCVHRLSPTFTIVVDGVRDHCKQQLLMLSPLLHIYSRDKNKEGNKETEIKLSPVI
jgi:hypothetical protein